MKNLVKSFIAVFLISFSFNQVQAQIYKNAAGLSVDIGDGTLVGPTFKHFFNSNSAGQIEVLFGDHVTVLQPTYTYNSGISGAAGLNWLIGAGPAFAFGNDDSEVAARLLAGLEYKISGAPLALAFDWRPMFWFTGGGSDVGRFGFGVKFAF